MTTTSTPAALIAATTALIDEATRVHNLTPEAATRYVLVRMGQTNPELLGRVLAAIPVR